jgi:exopolysaccharide biosynthesis polyprenyl glycosylphosphotransferase
MWDKFTPNNSAGPRGTVADLTQNKRGIRVAPDRQVEPRQSEPHDVMPRDLPVRRPAWESFYTRGLALTDIAVLSAAVAISEVIKFGRGNVVAARGPVDLSYTVLGLAIAVGWWAALTLCKSRDLRVVGEGTSEYRRIVRASVLLFGWVAIASVMLKIDMSRGYLAITFPFGLFLLVLTRKLWRVWLHRSRTRGRNITRVLVIGGIESALHTARMLEKSKGSGMAVSGVWIPDREGSRSEWLDVPGKFIPVMGTTRTISDALTIADADAVIVTDTEHLGPKGLRSLAWDLEGTDIDLMVSPNVVDVSGPRIHLRAVANMPFIHLEEPQYAGAANVSKVIFDKSIALTALLVLSPLFVAAGIAVKLTSPGPILYRSTRVGVGGEPFEMLKFRSMALNADDYVHALDTANEGAGPLFKMRDDPRITSVGKSLRRFSIDELPQLINVLRGEMSLVGPRPPLPSEVAKYEGHTSKRLLVRQGITGLWQVSGRSDLTWDETVRLDLDYVENWSMLRDVQIIWRTLSAVIGSRGAY